MKKIVVILALCIVSLSSCLETVTETQINKDGSGTMMASIDFSEMLKMIAAASGENADKGEKFQLDSVIYMKDHTDTSTTFTTRQKELLKNMQVSISMNLKEAESYKFTLTVSSPFKSLTMMNEINELLKTNEFDVLFDKAIKIPMLENDKEEEEEETANDNIFQSIFPAFLVKTYTNQTLVAKVDTSMYNSTMADFRGKEMNPDDENIIAMFEAATFTNRITLPGKPKKIEGGEWTTGSADNIIEQKGNLLELYKNPKKFEYTISY